MHAIRSLRALLLGPLMAAAAWSGAALAADTAFTYQGELRDSGTPAASYDFEVFLYADANGVTLLGGPFDFNDVVLDNGRFLLTIDAGSTVFTGPDRWLELRVRRGSETGGYTQMLPRQKLLATPYAQHADDTDFAATVADGAITTAKLANGAVTTAKVNSAQVQLRVAGSCGAGTVMSAVNANGTVNCTSLPIGDITDVIPGTGLTGGDDGTGSVSLAVDPVVVQYRVGAACAAGSAIRVVNQNGTVSCEVFPAVPTDYWSRNGNAGTDSATNFIGTTDAQAFEIRTNNVRSLRIEPSAEMLNGAPMTANVIGGSSTNGVTDGVRGATIAGGGVPAGSNTGFGTSNPNRVTDHYGTVGGGYGNTAGDGNGTLYTGGLATVGGGQGNTASGYNSTIGGGSGNIADGGNSTVAGGGGNVADGGSSSVAGGSSNVAVGDYSMVPGGASNCAGAPHSFAAGYNAIVRPPADPGFASCKLISYGGSTGDHGTFAWADDSTSGRLVSTGSNQFLVRATGGVWFGNTQTPPPLSSAALINTSTGAYLSTGGVWTNASDRNAKTDIVAIDTGDVFARVLALPLYTWRYKTQDAAIRHLGPMAQDFHAAFGLNGDDDKSIATVDPDGVALAAIQGLYAELDARAARAEARVEKLEAENTTLRAELAAIAQRLRALESAR